MTSDDLRAYLDAHGVDGAPADPWDGEWYAVAWSIDVTVIGPHFEIAVYKYQQGDKVLRSPSVEARSIARFVTRHALLPNFAAMARAARACPCMGRVIPGCTHCGGTGAVWVAP